VLQHHLGLIAELLNGGTPCAEMDEEFWEPFDAEPPSVSEPSCHAAALGSHRGQSSINAGGRRFLLYPQRYSFCIGHQQAVLSGIHDSG